MLSRSAHPPVAPLFIAFRVMVGLGLTMIGGRVVRRRGRHAAPDRRRAAVLRALSWMTFSGWVATLAGWYVTEIGRQPWIVYGLLRTADVVAPHPATVVGATLLAYALLVCLPVGWPTCLRCGISARSRPRRCGC